MPLLNHAENHVLARRGAPIARAKSVNHTVARVLRVACVVAARAAKKSTEGDDDEDEPGIDFAV